MIGKFHVFVLTSLSQYLKTNSDVHYVGGSCTFRRLYVQTYVPLEDWRHGTQLWSHVMSNMSNENMDSISLQLVHKVTLDFMTSK